MADDKEDKTEAPSDKRRTEARGKGNVPKSMEINSVLVLLAALMFIRIFGGSMFEQMGNEIRWYLERMADPVLSIDTFMVYFTHSTMVVAQVGLPVCLVIMVVGASMSFLQVGPLLTFTPITPKFEKINPIAGFKRLFSLRSVIEAIKSILKLTIIGIVAYVTIKAEFSGFLQLANMSSGQIWVFMMMVSFKVVLRIILALLVIAIFDFWYQRWEHERGLKMSKEEVKEENKQMEGDPKVKGRIRSLQREMARRRMIQDVPKATVVITNPTHLAIAIMYERDTMETPRVIAKGKNIMAEAIKEKARNSGVPILENKPLARAMYDKIEPGDDLPVEFFNAVAEILAYVYKLKNRMAA